MNFHVGFFYAPDFLSSRKKDMKRLLSLLLLLCPVLLCAQQRPDTTFAFSINEPEHEIGEGPVICIDAAHNNFHTADGGFSPFARVVKADGYQVKGITEKLTSESILADCSVLMIINPLHQTNLGNWVLPTPSAFLEEEIEIVNEWVRSGGAFFLIADHMPFAGAASDLGKSFGFEFRNGFATVEKEQNQPDVFSIQNGRLKESPITGNNVTSVTSFTGSSFQYPESAIPVMVFTEGDFSLDPQIAWQFEENTKTVPIHGYAQGALMNYGEGKLAVFGEAAMFTAQTIQTPNGTFNVGLNNKEMAPQNISFLLNLIHWLD